MSENRSNKILNFLHSSLLETATNVLVVWSGVFSKSVQIQIQKFGSRGSLFQWLLWISQISVSSTVLRQDTSSVSIAMEQGFQQSPQEEGLMFAEKHHFIPSLETSDDIRSTQSEERKRSSRQNPSVFQVLEAGWSWATVMKKFVVLCLISFTCTLGNLLQQSDPLTIRTVNCDYLEFFGYDILLAFLVQVLERWIYDFVRRNEKIFLNPLGGQDYSSGEFTVEFKVRFKAAVNPLASFLHHDNWSAGTHCNLFAICWLFSRDVSVDGEQFRNDER